MHFSRICVVSLALGCSLAANCGLAQQAGEQGAKAAKTASISSGRQTFASVCASCHGLDGKGGERGPDIVTRPEIAELTDEETLKILQAGIPEKGMPAFSAFGPAKLSALLSYLRTLQGTGAKAPVLGNTEKGRDLFSGKAGCSACHMVNGAGGFLGPDLSSYGGSHTPAEIRDAIVKPKDREGGRYAPAEVIAKDGRHYSGVVRNEDNFSLQLQSPDGTFHFLSKADLASINYRSEPLMPGDYGSKLTVPELDALAAFLAEAAHAKPKH